MVGIIISCIIGFILAKKKGLEFFDFTLIAIITLIGAWVGAKLLFLIISFDDVVNLFKVYPFQIALNKILTGGYVFYGGLIGGSISLFITLKIQKKNIFDYINIYAVVLPLGHAFGRIGCFVSGCCYGIEYNGPLSYTYSQAMDANTPLGVSLLPIQLIESFTLFIVFIILLLTYLKCNNKKLPSVLYCYIYPTLRFILEFFRGDRERGIWLLSTSQWISLFIILFISITIIITKYNSRKIHNKH